MSLSLMERYPPLFQSTPPRRGRRSWEGRDLLRCRVSIHAPAQGATFTLRRKRWTRQVSIHAPAQGATHREG